MTASAGFAFDLIALDVDGTLLNESHRLTPAVCAAVREAAGRGAQIVLCTGRGPAGAQPVLDELGLSGVMITHNGAATVMSGTRQIVHRYGISAADAEPFAAYCREAGLHFDLNTAFESYVEGLDEEAARMYELYSITPLLRTRDKGFPEGLVKLTVFGPEAAMDRTEREWAGWRTALAPIRSGAFFIDVQHPETNKGNALARLAESLDVSRERILAIGNYFNDIGMLRFAGTGIAMANSPKAVLEAADAVTASNEEDGVAAALRPYLD